MNVPESRKEATDACLSVPEGVESRFEKCPFSSKCEQAQTDELHLPQSSKKTTKQKEEEEEEEEEEG
jgi:hypothetical protein